MKRKEIISLVVFVLIIALAGYRYFHKVYHFSQSEFLLDTLITISVSSQEKEIKKTVEEAFELISGLEDELSCHKEGSSVWEMNSAKMDSFTIDENIFAMLKIGEELFQKTAEKYDLSIGVLTEIWDFDEQIIPEPAEIEEALRSVGFSRIEFRKGSLKKPVGMKLNFGSLAKGLIVDAAVDFLIKKNIRDGFINAGGDIRFFGMTKKRTVGIQHPRQTRNEVIEEIHLLNEAVVTSGDYERFFIKEGKRFHHIIDARTGYPSNDCVSVTVIATKAIIADAFSTALFLLPPEIAIQLANEADSLEAKVFYEDKGGLKSLQSTDFAEYTVK